MLLDIKLVKSSSMFCFESAVASFAVWQKRNYEMMFCKMWGFDFLPPGENGQLIGRRITACFNQDDMCQLLEEYHGITVTTERIGDIHSLKKTIINQLKKGIPQFLSFNERFAFFIIGYTYSDFLLLDVHQNLKDVRKMSFRNFPEVIRSLKSQSFFLQSFHASSGEKQDITYKDFVRLFKMRNNYSENIFTAMKNLAAAVNENLDLQLEKKEDNSSIYWLPILINIKHLCRARMLISSSLDYIWKTANDNIAYNLSSRFIQLGDEWNTVWNVVNKAFYVPDQINKIKRKMADRICKIADWEEQLVSHIINDTGFNQKCFIKREVVKKDWDNNNITFLDIGKYLNNKALSTDEKNNDKSDFSGRSDFIILKDFQDKKIRVNDMVFQPLVTKEYDNIICSGQIVAVPENIYNRISFLGCSIWGSNSGLFTVKYSDDYAETSQLSFPDFFQKDLLDGTLAYSGDYYYNNIKQEFSLFAISYVLEYKANMISIQLPVQENLHIFAISLIAKQGK